MIDPEARSLIRVLGALPSKARRGELRALIGAAASSIDLDRIRCAADHFGLRDHFDRCAHDALDPSDRARPPDVYLTARDIERSVGERVLVRARHADGATVVAVGVLLGVSEDEGRIRVSLDACDPRAAGRAAGSGDYVHLGTELSTRRASDDLEGILSIAPLAKLASPAAPASRPRENVVRRALEIKAQGYAPQVALDEAAEHVLKGGGEKTVFEASFHDAVNREAMAATAVVGDVFADAVCDAMLSPAPIEDFVLENDPHAALGRFYLDATVAAASALSDRAKTAHEAESLEAMETLLAFRLQHGIGPPRPKDDDARRVLETGAGTGVRVFRAVGELIDVLGAKFSPAEKKAIFIRSIPLMMRIAKTDIDTFVAMLPQLESSSSFISSWRPEIFTLSGEPHGLRIGFKPSALAEMESRIGASIDVNRRKTAGCPALARLRNDGSAIERLALRYADDVEQLYRARAG